MDTDTIKKLAMSRRALMAAAAGAGVGLVTEEVRAAQGQTMAATNAIAAAVPDITVKSVETFDIQVPQPPQPAGAAEGRGGPPGRINVTRVETNNGVRGYSFLGSSPESMEAVNKLLAGQSLFAIESYLKNGLLEWGAVEEAMWDAIGKIAGQPVSRLLGGASLPSVPVYVTYTWPRAADGKTAGPKERGKAGTLLKQAGFKACKIQIFNNDDFNIDVEACSEIMAAAGPGFKTMVDRTAGNSGKLWDYATALAAGKALQKAGVYWLEEPLARDDYEGPARLAKELDILITGGEGYRGLEPYRQCLMHGTYDILQPELRQVSGVLMVTKVGTLCNAWGIKLAPHGSSGLAWAGRVQASSAAGSHIQEISVLQPPILPNDLIAPFLPILHGVHPFVFKNGEVLVPQAPGLGLNVDEVAINKFRVEGFSQRRPPARPPGAGAAPGAAPAPAAR